MFSRKVPIAKNAELFIYIEYTWYVLLNITIVADILIIV